MASRILVVKNEVTPVIYQFLEDPRGPHRTQSCMLAIRDGFLILKGRMGEVMLAYRKGDLVVVAPSSSAGPYRGYTQKVSGQTLTHQEIREKLIATAQFKRGRRLKVVEHHSHFSEAEAPEIMFAVTLKGI